MAGLRDALSRLLAIQGVRATVLAGREGLPIEAVGRGDARLFDALAALGASALSTADALAQELPAGATVGAIMEYERALVSVDPLGEYAAVVTLADGPASLGRIRQAVQAGRDELLRLLDAR